MSSGVISLCENIKYTQKSNFLYGMNFSICAKEISKYLFCSIVCSMFVVFKNEKCTETFTFIK